MPEVPLHNKLPDWITENLPPELAGSTLFRFNVKLQAIEHDAAGKPVQKTITVNLLPDLDLDYEILEQQMQSMPAQYAFWSAVYSEVRLAAAVAERKMKIRRGTATTEVCKTAAEEGVKLSAEQVKQVIEADDRLVRADMEFQNAQMQTGKLYHMLEALKMRAELARSLAGFKRQEYEKQ